MSIQLPLPENLSKVWNAHIWCANNQSLLETAGHPQWREHIHLIDESIKMLELLLQGHGRTSDDLFAIHCLGSRLYNDCTTAFILIFSGYYQSSTMPMRDALECCLLLMLFKADPSEVKRWREATRKENLSHFKFSKMRESLEKNYNAPREFLDRLDTAHKALCHYGVHPTYESNVKMQLKEDRLYYGSFFNEKLCGNLLAELARTSSLILHELVEALCVDNLSTGLKVQYELWSKQAWVWLTKYKTFPTKEQAGKLLD